MLYFDSYLIMRSLQACTDNVATTIPAYLDIH